VKPVAWVAGDPLDVSDVDERERAIRSGPASAALPDVDSSEGRQLRRWLVQLIAAERLIAREAGERRVTVEHAPPLDELAADRPALLELGSVAASLLAGSALARAVFAAVTAHVRVNHDRIKRYHADNPEQFLSSPSSASSGTRSWPAQTEIRGSTNVHSGHSSGVS
jgi:[acyl-carrier-protein] S-malonyltransferase